MQKRTQRIRVDNYLAANERIEALSAATINSEYPDLLYYHWSRYGNQRSLDKFLSMEGSALVETSNAQFNLATYYSKRDIDKTLRLLFRSLELNKTNKINTEIFKSLSSIFTERKEYKQAYIWLNILHLYDEEDETVSESTLVEFSRHHQLDAKFLAQVAKATLAKIEAGKFISPV